MPDMNASLISSSSNKVPPTVIIQGHANERSYNYQEHDARAYFGQYMYLYLEGDLGRVGEGMLSRIRYRSVPREPTRYLRTYTWQYRYPNN